MLVFLRVLVACIMGAALGSLVSCVRHRKDAQTVVIQAPAAKPGVKPSSFSLPVPSVTSDSKEKPKGQPSPIEAQYRAEVPEDPLTVTGWVMRGLRVNVQLSDGRILTERDAEYAHLERNALHLKTGQRIFIVPRRPKSSPASNAPELPVAAPADGVKPAGATVPAVQSSWEVGFDGVSRLTASAASAAPAR